MADPFCVVCHKHVVKLDVTGWWPVVGGRLLSAVDTVSISGECPKHPLWGTYLRRADVLGLSRRAVTAALVLSTPSAGGVT
jgi:hypothetical protein